MKTLLKVLGIAAGAYCMMDFGWCIGVFCCKEYYDGRLNMKNVKDVKIKEDIEAANELWEMIRKDKKSSKKRSDVIRKHAKRWSDQGYSSEEIKQGLDALKKELD